MSRPSEFALLRAKKWIDQLRKRSFLAKKYGSFLPEQEELLKKVHERFQGSKRKIWTFTAPPASGKTHVIALLAQFLSEENLVAIIVPNDYLKQQFHEQESLVSGHLEKVDILNLVEYLRTNKTYEFILMDEAHNLKSSVELNSNLVKTFKLTPEDALCQDLQSRLLPANKQFAAKQLPFTSCKEALDQLLSSSRLRKLAIAILKDPVSWKCFAYVRREGQSKILFVRSPVCSLKTPSKVMMLFSATPLSRDELSFYCGLRKEATEEPCVVKATTRGKRLFFSIPNSLSFSSKIDLLSNILKENSCRVLVLFNNSLGCDKAYNRISLPSRDMFCIKTQAKARKDIYEDFVKCKNGVLFTSSQVFWEGITIKDLRLVVFFDPPYPHPHLLDLKEERRIYGKQDLVRRLNQGMGRIGRKDWGVGILLFGVTEISKLLNFEVLKIQPWSLLLLVHKMFLDETISIDDFT